jgi:hypothetical protein
VADTGAIGIAGPEGIVCTVTETAAPPGYDLPADPSFEFTIPAGSAGQEIDFIEDPPTKAETSISTSATSGDIGDAISDTATLSGATDDATGTITFNLYDTPDCSGEPVFTSEVAVDGPGDYVSGEFTPAADGEYNWIASYSGDVKNLASTGTCGDDGETSTLTPSPSLSTSATVVTSSSPPPPSLSFEPTSAGPVANTGAGPITDEIGWAAALLALGGAAAVAGKRRGYRRMH